MNNQWKKDFPLFQTHPDLAYLDSAATSQKPQVVIDAIMDFYTSSNANIHRGIYPLAEKATEAVEAVREQVRGFINATYPEEIIFVRSTTEAINLVATSFGEELIREGDTVAVPLSEHHSNFVPWQQLALRKKAAFQVLPLTKVQSIDFSNLEQSAKLLAFSHVSNVLGTITPVAETIHQAKKRSPQVKVLIDAAQSAPHLPIDVQEMDCDFLVFSGHKMLAETGIGILYGKKELLERMPPFLYGGNMIREVSTEKTTFASLPAKFEAGTLNLSGIISLGAAIEYLESIGLDKIQQHDQQLLTYCVEEIKKLPEVTILGPEDVGKRSSIITFTMGDIHPHDIAQILGDEGVCIRAGHHCTMPLHTALNIPASARASFYLYNTEEDVERLIEGLKRVKKVFI